MRKDTGMYDMERNKSGKELRKSGVLDRLFARSDEDLRSRGLLPKDGHIVVATFVEVPMSRLKPPENGLFCADIPSAIWRRPKGSTRTT